MKNNIKIVVKIEHKWQKQLSSDLIVIEISKKLYLNKLYSE